MQKPIAVMLDIDDTLISTAGAGARSWRWAFNEMHGIAAEFAQFSDTGVTDPELAYRIFVSVAGRTPTGHEIATLLAKYPARLPYEVATFEGYKVLDGVPQLLPRLFGERILLGITTGAVQSAAQIKPAPGQVNAGAIALGVATGHFSRANL